MQSFSGRLDGLNLLEAMRVVASVTRDARLHAAWGGWDGQVGVEAGRIVHASFGPEQGADALAAMILALPHGPFQIAHDISEAERNLDLSIEAAVDQFEPLSKEANQVFRDRLAPGCAVRVVPKATDASEHEQLVLNSTTVHVLLDLQTDSITIRDIAERRGLAGTLRALCTLTSHGFVELVDTGSAPATADRRTPRRGGPMRRLGRRLKAIFVRPAALSRAMPQTGPATPPQTYPDAHRQPAEMVLDGLHDRGLFSALGRGAYKHRWRILLVGLALVAASGFIGIDVFTYAKTGGFVDPASESTRVSNLLRDQLGRDDGTLVVLFTGESGFTLDQPEYRQAVEATLDQIKDDPDVGQIFTYYNTGLAQFVSDDNLSTYAAVGLRGGDDEQVKEVARLRPLLTSDRLQVQLGGRPAVYEELTQQVQADLHHAELITFPVIGVLLVLIFGSLVASTLPLAIGGTAILGAFCILRIAAGFTDLSVFSLNIITMLGFGLAIDYSLFVVSRFREELRRCGGHVQLALRYTMQTAGHTVLFSGLTVIISLLSLLVFAPMFLRSMGFGAATAVLVAVVASLSILPALLAVLGERVNALSLGSLLPGRRKSARFSEAETSSGVWYRLSDFVMRHPRVVLILTAAPLIVAGLPFLRISFAVFDARSLPATHESRAVDSVLRDSFPRNETQPLQIVVHTTRPVLEPGSIGALYDYVQRVVALPGVRRVDSLVTLDPQLDKAAYAGFYSDANRAQDPRAAQAAQQFANGNYTVVSVLYDDTPYSSASQTLANDVRRVRVPSGLTAQVGGEPAYLVDFLHSLALSVPLAFALVVGVMFALLFLMFGSLVIPLKAVLLNILTLSASFGVLVWVFQDGRLADLLGFTPTGTIDAAQPVLMFAGAFGLSMDYQVFLLSRIKEHYDRTKDIRSAVSLGVQRTGGIITSAALLLAVVIGSFATGEVLFIKQIGVGLAVAIVVDATIVRSLLVPAAMRLMGDYNWWAPGAFAALYRRLSGKTASAADPMMATPTTTELALQVN
jgi:trehalose monomycolate/heme transporter